MIEDTFTLKSAFSDFQILHAHFNGDNKQHDKEYFRALHSIMITYGLERNELQLVTYLAHMRPNGLLIKKAKDIYGPQYGGNDMSVIDSLQKKNFIRTCITSSGQSFITFTSDAINAFNRYESFGIIRKVDFIKMIRSTNPAMMNSAMWAKEFKRELDDNKDSEFARNWSALTNEGLSDNETTALCTAIRHFILHFTEPVSCEGKGKMDINDTADEPAKSAHDALVQRGLLVTNGNGYVIAPKVAEQLLSGHDEVVNYDEISSRVQVIKCCDITKKELFFSPESQEEIDHLQFMLSKDGFAHVRSILKKKKRNPAIQSLLWGGPGTGKTETVKQIALETGRDIFLFDVAKVTASEWGATENLYRSLFMSYRYIVAVKSLTPILLINEADQVLSRRLSELEHSIDKAENTVSNILLQEFEDMHGILLATTNNVDILDKAFDRRFLFKTELQKPDARARKAIWRSMIPELSEADAEILANKYEMSGAQINNVATKRDLAELYFYGDRGLSFIEMLCGKELCTEKQNRVSRRIGF